MARRLKVVITKRLISVKVIVLEKPFASRFAVSDTVPHVLPSYYSIGT